MTYYIILYYIILYYIYYYMTYHIILYICKLSDTTLHLNGTEQRYF